MPNSDVVTYRYDGHGRRAIDSLNGVEQSIYLYRDNQRIVAQLDGSGHFVSNFIWGTRPNVPEYMIKNGNTYRLITDPRGSVRMVVDVDTGTVAQEITYNEYGKVLSDTSPGFQPFYFAGGLYDTNTGLLHFDARDYDPETGRWISKDPIMFGGGDTNLYGYVLQDPVNFVDPSGLYRSINNQGGWQILVGGRGGGMSDSAGTHLAAGFAGMMAGGTALATSPAGFRQWLDCVWPTPTPATRPE